MAAGQAPRRTVEPGDGVGGVWPARSGLAPADDVIVSGNEKRNPGQAVTIVELPPPGPPTVPSMRAADETEGSAGL